MSRGRNIGPCEVLMALSVAALVAAALFLGVAVLVWHWTGLLPWHV